MCPSPQLRSIAHRIAQPSEPNQHPHTYICDRLFMRTKRVKRTICPNQSASAVNKGFQPSRTKRTKRTILENLFQRTKTSQVSLYYIYYYVYNNIYNIKILCHPFSLSLHQQQTKNCQTKMVRLTRLVRRFPPAFPLCSSGLHSANECQYRVCTMSSAFWHRHACFS